MKVRMIKFCDKHCWDAMECGTFLVADDFEDCAWVESFRGVHGCRTVCECGEISEDETEAVEEWGWDTEFIGGG